MFQKLLLCLHVAERNVSIYPTLALDCFFKLHLVFGTNNWPFVFDVVIEIDESSYELKRENIVKCLSDLGYYGRQPLEVD